MYYGRTVFQFDYTNVVYQFLPESNIKPDKYNLILEIVYFDEEGELYTSKVSDIQVTLRTKPISNITIMCVFLFQSIFIF